MKFSAFAAVLAAGMCPLAAAAVISAGDPGDSKASQQFGGRPVLTETSASDTSESVHHIAPLHVDWFTNAPSPAKWSWVRPQTTTKTRLPSPLVSIPAPGAAAVLGLAGLFVARRRA